MLKFDYLWEHNKNKNVVQAHPLKINVTTRNDYFVY